MRDLLGPAFIRLEAGFTVAATIDGESRSFAADAAAAAYARALLALLDSLAAE